MHPACVYQRPGRRLSVDAEDCGKDGFKRSFGIRAMQVEQIVLGFGFYKSSGKIPFNFPESARGSRSNTPESIHG